MSQADRLISSLEVPTSQVILLCVKWTKKTNQYSIQLLLKWIHSSPRNMEPILGTIMGAENLRLDSHRPLVENQLLFL